MRDLPQLRRVISLHSDLGWGGGALNDGRDEKPTPHRGLCAHVMITALRFDARYSVLYLVFTNIKYLSLFPTCQFSVGTGRVGCRGIKKITTMHGTFAQHWQRPRFFGPSCESGEPRVVRLALVSFSIL